MVRIAAFPTFVALFCTFLTAAEATEVSDADRQSFEQIVLDQMAAFQADDGATAWSYASPGIRQRIGTPERFLGMVRNGYAPVYRPRAVTFSDVTDELGGPTQRAHIIGPRGNTWIALYGMERQPDGDWRISGCVLIRSPGSDA